jgi:hypothetical protein
MKTSQGGSPRIVQGEVVSSRTERAPEKLPGYEETIAATGIDPAVLFAESAPDCSCNWGGHRVYNLR